ncbi:MAG: hypothetical protein QOE62_15, partial [Actinomycetota bacterium]|nr:hypothetical protein [Actinomycetota bacterium]
MRMGTSAVAASTTGDCGCSSTGPYVAPAEGADLYVSATGTSPTGKYTVTSTPTGAPDGLANVTVALTASPGTPLVTTQAQSWGFSPDDDRFVAHYVQDPAGSSIHHIELYNLVGSNPGASILSDPSVSTGSDRIQFSPSGRYLFYAYISSGQTHLQMVDATTGQTTYTSAFTPVTVSGSGHDEFGVAGWGFGPDDSRFVYAWNSTSSNVEWNIVNLERSPSTALVKTISMIGEVGSFWQFSPCGDVIGLVHQPGVSPRAEVYNTNDGTSAGPPGEATISAPFQDITLATTATSQVVTNTTASGPTDYTLGPNTAATSCGGGGTTSTVPTTTAVNHPPAAHFTSPAGVQAGFDVTFQDASADSDGHIAAWLWNFGDGWTSTEQNPTHMYTNPAGATYTVSLQVTDDGGAVDSTSQELIVAPNAPPEASFTFAPNPVVRGDTVTFTDTSTDDDGITQELWIIGNDGFSGPTVTLKICEPVNVQLTVSDHLYQYVDAPAVTIVVSATGQVIPVPAGGSLQDAVSQACPGDTVSLAPGTYSGGVTLNQINLEGAGAGSSIVSGTTPDSDTGGWVLATSGRGDVAISNLSVRDGQGGILAGNDIGVTRLDGVEVDHNTDFGGIFVDCCRADLSVDASSIHDNHTSSPSGAGGGGIGMFCCGDITVTNTEIAFNSSNTDGGGVYPEEAGQVIFTGDSIHDNTASGQGGGVYLDSDGNGDVFTNNRFVGNSASQGGALTIVRNQLLFAGNLVAHNAGGGVHTDGSGRAVIINATIVDNTGVGVDSTGFSSAASIYNSIVGGNDTDLDSSSICGPNLIGHLPAFADGDYHLAPGSAAIDAGDNSKVPSELATDADGQARIQNGTVDLGYDEFQGFGGGTGGAGSIPTTCVAPAPPNDDFANAQELSGDSGTVDGTNVGGTAEAGEPDHAGS